MPSLINLISAYPDHRPLDPTFHDCEITFIAFDSRQVKKDSLFVAFKGAQADGLAYIPDAVARGARAIVVADDVDVPGLPKHIALIRVASPRRALALLAAKFYGQQPAHIVAVTGTDGKTSTVHFTRLIWEMLGYKAASIGTLGIIGAGGGALYPGSHTTPDPVALHRILTELAEQHYTHVAIEASSHGLDQHRLDGVNITAAAFTNFTRDHLDYHATVEDYFNAKARLFKDVLEDGGAAVLNVEDERSATLIKIASQRDCAIIEYGQEARQLRILSHLPASGGQDVSLAVEGVPHDFHLPLVGGFQLYNVLAAVGLVMALGEKAEKLLPLLPRLQPVPGRLQRVAVDFVNKKMGDAPSTPLASRLALLGHSQATEGLGDISGAEIFIDYAHTPAALAKALETLRPHVRHRLLVVFGCGGDRDKGKRPEMGNIAAALADRVIVTDDNPRSEDAATIRREIMAACPDALEIADRRQAIYTAMEMLEAGDVLLIAGKGHETVQIIGDTQHPFNDAEVVRERVG